MEKSSVSLEAGMNELNQSKFLDDRKNQFMNVYLVNGIKLAGQIKGHDQFAVFISLPNGSTQMVYKHAIATVSPAA